MMTGGTPQGPPIPSAGFPQRLELWLAPQVMISRKPTWPLGIPSDKALLMMGKLAWNGGFLDGGYPQSIQT